MRTMLILMSLLICLMPWRMPWAESGPAAPVQFTIR